MRVGWGGGGKTPPPPPPPPQPRPTPPRPSAPLAPRPMSSSAQRPLSSAPRPAQSFTPRSQSAPSAIPYQKKEEKSVDELRSILSNLVKKEPAQTTPPRGLSAPVVRERTESKDVPPLRPIALRSVTRTENATRAQNTPRPETPSARPAEAAGRPPSNFPKRLHPTEEAKAVEKGKGDLKAALSALVKPESAPSDTARAHVSSQQPERADSIERPRQHEGQSGGRERRAGNVNDQQRTTVDDQVARRTLTPQEIPEQELRTLLGKIANDSS
jgi:hypothetical protein